MRNVGCGAERPGRRRQCGGADIHAGRSHTAGRNSNSARQHGHASSGNCNTIGRNESANHTASTGLNFVIKSAIQSEWATFIDDAARNFALGISLRNVARRGQRHCGIVGWIWGGSFDNAVYFIGRVFFQPLELCELFFELRRGKQWIVSRGSRFFGNECGWYTVPASSFAG